MSQLPPPEHVAIIMDGNSRWARERLLPRVMGHKAGIETIRRVAEAADRRGVRVLTLYAFSTENWSRPRDEVDALMTLFSETIRREVDELARRGIELRFSGRLQDLSTALQDQIRQMLSTSLKGVIAQTLCPKIGGGRVAAYEILRNTPNVGGLIRDSKTFQIPTAMQTGGYESLSIPAGIAACASVARMQATRGCFTVRTTAGPMMCRDGWLVFPNIRRHTMGS